MLASVLETVSENCLRGRPAPDALRVLWEAQLAGRSPIAAPDFGEVELVSEYDDEFFEGYDAKSCGDASVARAYARLFRQIAFIGRESEGGLLGFWLASDGDEIDDAPVIVLDSEGQFHCTAANLQDHFIQAAEDPAAIAAIRAWFHDRGVEASASPEAVWESIEGLPDPNELSWGYQAEEAGDA